MLSLFGRQKRLLALDLGSRNVKVVEVSVRGPELTVTGYGEARIGSDQDKVAAVHEIVTQRGMTRRTATAISGRDVIVRYVSLPPMPDAQLTSAVHAEAEKFIPFETDKVVVAFQKIETDPTSKQVKVALVAVRRSIVDDHIAILHAAGLEPAIVDIDVFAIGNAFTCARGLERTPEEPPKVRALVDIGASKTSINILRGGVSQFAREVYVAGNDLLTDLARGLNNAPEEAERAFISPGERVDQILDIISPVLEDLGQEIRLSFEFYKEQFDKSVEEVYLSGGSSQLPKLDKFLERIFDVTTNRWDPTENLSFAMDSVAVDRVKQDSPRLAVAVGLASRALTSQQL